MYPLSDILVAARIHTSQIPPTPMPTPPRLKVPRREALRLLAAAVREGEDLFQKRISTVNGLEKLRAAAEEWMGNNLVLLEDILTTRAYMTEYAAELPSNWRIGRKPLADEIERFRGEIGIQLSVLESIRKRVELLAEAIQNQTRGKATASSRVFIVHGHDEKARLAVETFLRRLDLEPVVLSDQASGGKTIIEKFESNSADVAYAVVLLTPDDAGHAAAKASDVTPRARQNVIFELGYFVAKLGRQRVCPLYVQGVELPSDLHGVVYVPMDENERWHLHLAKELRQSGLPVDMNKL